MVRDKCQRHALVELHVLVVRVPARRMLLEFVQDWAVVTIVASGVGAELEEGPSAPGLSRSKSMAGSAGWNIIDCLELELGKHQMLLV